jgi:hypothetical protein
VKIGVGNKNDCLLRNKNDEKFFQSFSGRGLCFTHVGAPCCETWLKFGVKDFRCSKKLKLKKMFGSWFTPLVGRHVVNESKVVCHVANELGIF